jgi:hypothetical protein
MCAVAICELLEWLRAGMPKGSAIRKAPPAHRAHEAGRFL